MSPLPKPHIRIRSEGNGRETHVLFVDEQGREHVLPGAQACTWSLQSPNERAHASVVFSGVRADVRAIAAELADSHGEETWQVARRQHATLKAAGWTLVSCEYGETWNHADHGTVSDERALQLVAAADDPASGYGGSE